MVKIVRDRVPLLVRGARFVLVDRATACSLLRYKLVEEVVEFLKSGSVEELADILEVVEALGRCEGVSLAELMVMKEVKRVERGASKRGSFYSSNVHRGGATRHHLPAGRGYPGVGVRYSFLKRLF